MIGCFLVLAYTQRENGHVRIDFLVERLPGKSRHYTELAALTLTLIVCLIFLWQSILQSSLAITMRLYTSGIMEYPLWPARVLVSVGLLFLCVRLVLQVWDMATRKQPA